MGQIIPKKKKKRTESSVFELLDHINRLTEEVDKMKEVIAAFHQKRMSSLGPLFKEIRELLFKQITALDRLYTLSITPKNVQKEISKDITEIVNYLKTNFQLESDEVDSYQKIIQFHTGSKIEWEELPDEFDSEKKSTESVIELNALFQSKDLKAIYKELAKEFHPDINPTAEAEEKMKELTHYYETQQVDALVKLYHDTFKKETTLDQDPDLLNELHEKLDLLQDEYDLVYQRYFVIQQMSEKSITKKVKSEVKSFKDFIQQQKQLLTLVYADLDYYQEFIKIRK